MAFRTLGEAVLAAHRAEQADNDANPDRSTPDANHGAGSDRAGGNGRAGNTDDTGHADGTGNGHDDIVGTLSPTWIIQYFISQRPRCISGMAAHEDRPPPVSAAGPPPPDRDRRWS